jgi:hypothetical protein
MTAHEYHDLHPVADVQLFESGKIISWRGLRCRVEKVHKVRMSENEISWTASYYVMREGSTTFNVSFDECHSG